MRSRHLIARSLGVAALVGGVATMTLAPGASAQAVPDQVLVLRGSTLVRIDPSVPGTAVATASVTGLDAGDRLLGIDLRSSNATLYGIGSSGRIYTIDPTTGVAVAGPTAATAPVGTSFGVDFNPVADRLRVVSNTGQSLRINVADGVTVVDGSIAYGAADPGSGTTPSIVAVAYTNPDNDMATGTELFDLESTRDVLALQTPPNDGVLASRGALGADAGAATAFDISPSGQAMAIVAGTLRSVDLTTGVSTAIGTVSGGAPADGMAFVPALAAGSSPTTSSTVASTPTSGPGATTPTTAREIPKTGSENLRIGLTGGALVALGAGLLGLSANRRGLLR